MTFRVYTFSPGPQQGEFTVYPHTETESAEIADHAMKMLRNGLGEHGLVVVLENGKIVRASAGQAQ